MVTRDENYAAKTVRALAAVMREVGATRVRIDGLEIDLGPAPVVPSSEPEDKPEPTLCRCGHDHMEHNETGCGHGCSLERCAGSPQHPEPETP